MGVSLADPQPFLALESAARQAPPSVAIVLGSGMGAVARNLRVDLEVDFGCIPELKAASVLGHRGRLAFGEWAGRRVLFFEGRLHYYEGNSWQDVVVCARLAHELGARCLVLTNAAGGIHDSLGAGGLMAVRAHVEWTRPRCWLFSSPAEPSLAIPSAPYSTRLLRLLQQSARQKEIDLFMGVYASVTGPNYETPAEIRALKKWGADAVGMSTAREAQAAADLGMECAAISCITNRAAGLGSGIICHDEVLAAACRQIPRLTDLLEGFFELLS